MAATMTGTPVTDALIAVFEDAIAYREPDITGCCPKRAKCGDHQADQDRAGAMAKVLGAIRNTDDDEDTLAVLAIAPLDILAAITPAAPEGGARDDG